jgi:hypothetical protein
MNVKDFTYTELNKMFGDLVEEHADDTEFFSPESEKAFADSEMISGDYIGVQNALDELATKVEGLKDVFDWSCGIDGNSYDVGLVHKNHLYESSVRNAMIHAECLRRNVDMDAVREFVRITKEMECVRI